MRTVTFLLILVAAGCHKRCPPGTQVGRGGKCLGVPTPESARNVPRTTPARPRELAKRSPLTAPELKPLPAVSALLLGGATPRWYAAAEEVRKQTGLGGRFMQNTAWGIGPVYTLTATPNLNGVPLQVDYLFLGDNLIGYSVLFFVYDAPSQKLYDTLLGQAIEAYGPPKSRNDQNTDWALPQLAVHFAFTPNMGMQTMAKRPAHTAHLTWTVPPTALN